MKASMGKRKDVDICEAQAAISWRASDDRQISLSASAERAFANFRDKKTSYFTMANFCNKNNACPSVGSPAQAL